MVTLIQWWLIWQHYIKLKEEEKNRKLNDLLDALDFNQVVIFVKSVSRAAELDKLLVECNFPSICIHSGMSQEERFVWLMSMDVAEVVSIHCFGWRLIFFIGLFYSTVLFKLRILLWEIMCFPCEIRFGFQQYLSWFCFLLRNLKNVS